MCAAHALCRTSRVIDLWFTLLITRRSPSTRFSTDPWPRKAISSSSRHSGPTRASSSSPKISAARYESTIPTRIHSNACTHFSLFPYLYTRTHARTRARMRIHTHTHTHTRKHTHTHTRPHPGQNSTGGRRAHLKKSRNPRIHGGQVLDGQAGRQQNLRHARAERGARGLLGL